MELPILYEDNHLLIVNKPAGILAQGDVTGDLPVADIAKSYIKKKYNKPGEVFLGVVHRLDRPVSGAVVLARTSEEVERLNALFRERETEKTYWAIVGRKPASSQGTLVHWLLKDEKKNKTTFFTKETTGALRSELRFKVLAEATEFVLLEVIPVTGRSHQIRVQLSAMGCPIKGDLKYGDTDSNDGVSISLHAIQISFIHPVKKELLRTYAPTPDSGLWMLFKNIERSQYGNTRVDRTP